MMDYKNDIKSLQQLLDAATQKGIFAGARAAAAMQAALDRLNQTLEQYETAREQNLVQSANTGQQPAGQQPT